MSKKSLKNIPLIRFKGFSDEWETCKLGDILKYEQPTEYIVKSTEYSDNFDVPVLTAGQSFILGYTNETEGVKNADSNNPIIIFDDFTTSIHYVNFPFKVKSSAMKLLALKDEFSNLNFVYNLMKNLKYVPQNHERHWISKYSDFEIRVPSTEEQNKIGNFFKDLEDHISVYQRYLDILRVLKKVMLIKLFPINRESKPELQLKGFNNIWEHRKLSEITSLITKGTTPLDKSSSGNINYVKIENIDSISGKVTITTKISEKEHNEYLKRSQLKEGDVLFSIAGTLGRVTIVNSEILPANTNQALAIIRLNSCNSDYIATYLKGKTISEFVKINPTIGAQPNLSLEQVGNLEVALPIIDEQHQIGSFFIHLDNLIDLHQREIENLKSLKQLLSNHMFI